MNNLKMDGKEIEDVIEILNELQEDITVPKNVRIKIEKIINSLKESAKPLIKINEALNDLDEIAADVNLQPYTRTQIWNIISTLEKTQ